MSSARTTNVRSTFCGLGPFAYDAESWARPDADPWSDIGGELVSRVYQLGTRDALLAPLRAKTRSRHQRARVLARDRSRLRRERICATRLVDRRGHSRRCALERARETGLCSPPEPWKTRDCCSCSTGRVLSPAMARSGWAGASWSIRATAPSRCACDRRRRVRARRSTICSAQQTARGSSGALGSPIRRSKAARCSTHWRRSFRAPHVRAGGSARGCAPCSPRSPHAGFPMAATDGRCAAPPRAQSKVSICY